MDIKIDKAPHRAHNQDLVGRAVVIGLNEAPDDSWKAHFGKSDGLARYFAKIRFEGPQMLLFFGTRKAPDQSLDALDEVKSAIDHANDARRAEIAKSAVESKRRREQNEAENERLDSALEQWSATRLG